MCLLNCVYSCIQNSEHSCILLKNRKKNTFLYLFCDHLFWSFWAQRAFEDTNLKPGGKEAHGTLCLAPGLLRTLFLQMQPGVSVEAGLGMLFSTSSALIQTAHRCQCQLPELPGSVVRPSGSLLLSIACCSPVSLELLELTPPTVLATGCWEGCRVDSVVHLPCYGLVSCGFSWKLTVVCNDVFVRKQPPEF